MDIRPITDRFSVSPQIAIEDLTTLAQQGYRAVICNRPDAELTPDLQADAMRAAAQDAGLQFHCLPVGAQGITPQIITEMTRLLAEIDGPILAYCRSGTRSCNAWALAVAPQTPAEQIVSAAADAGYDLRALQPHLQALAAQAGG